jgi:hypothetical protein
MEACCCAEMSGKNWLKCTAGFVEAKSELRPVREKLQHSLSLLKNVIKSTYLRTLVPSYKISNSYGILSHETLFLSCF